jgi:hypothetical protein
MKLTDEQVVMLRAQSVHWWPFTETDDIHALATEVLESRATIERLERQIDEEITKAMHNEAKLRLESRSEIARLTKERDEAQKWERLHEGDGMRLTDDIRNQITVTIDGNISSDFRHYVSSYTTATGAVFTITGPLAVALRRISVSSLDVDRLTDIITDSIDLDWTPRTAAKAIVRAMGGTSHDNG